MKRRNGQKYYPPPEFVPADVGPNGAPIMDESVPVFNETAEQRREREEEEEREDRERRVRFMAVSFLSSIGLLYCMHGLPFEVHFCTIILCCGNCGVHRA